MADANGTQVPVRVSDNKDRTYRVEFETSVIGVYTANVSFASLQVPGSPFKVTVVPVESDVNNAQVKDLPQSVYSAVFETETRTFNSFLVN